MMKKCIILVVAAMSILPMAMEAQSVVKSIGSNVQSTLGSPTYEQWYAQYEAVGNAINEVSAQYQSEVERRGYPKKKTVKKKMALVEQYIKLLEMQLDYPGLNQDVDTQKVERKIAEWQTQLNDLKALLEKI